LAAFTGTASSCSTTNRMPDSSAATVVDSTPVMSTVTTGSSPPGSVITS
jgi:hypothetical protein